MSVKSIIQGALAPIGLELHRLPDPSLPLLHELQIDGVTRRLWLANPFTKSWWFKPEVPLNGELSELKRLCAPGNSVLEVGAHHGMMTTLLSCGAGSRR